MVKKFIAVALMGILAFTNPLTARAGIDAVYAGRFLSEIISIITNEYAGGEVSEEDLLKAALRGMSMILDPYSDYMDEETYARFTGGLSGRLTGIGVVVRQNSDTGRHVIKRVIPSTPAQEAGLKRGDVIMAVNGSSTENLSLDQVIAIILEAESEIILEALRGGETITFTMTKREIPSISVFVETLDEILGEAGMGYDSIRYIAVTSISVNTAAVLKAAMEDLKREGVTGIILDLRGNTGGYLDVAIEICNFIVPRGPICHIVDARGNRETISSRLVHPPYGQMVVLVDRYTASGAELIAAALQDAESAIIVGELTFGKGVIQGLYTLSGIGGALRLTTEEYLRRNGEKINEVGITPDYIIEMDFDKYETPEDDMLIKALELLMD
jgi:carboxyl-terminal processing protease